MSIPLLALVLAVLASALQPVTAAPERAARATLSVSKEVAAAGDRLTFRGRLTTSPNRRVVLQRQARKGWVRVARTQTSGAGRFLFVRPARKQTTRYRVHLASRAIGSRRVSSQQVVLSTPVRTVVAKKGSGARRPSGRASDERPEVLFSDDFTGAGTYDHTKWGEWSTCTYNASAAYGNIQCGDRARLNGKGQLVIPATPDQGTSLSTKDTFRATYGTFTARIKVPTQSGYWPAFWTLNSTTTGEGTNGLVGEADVLEGYTEYDDGYRTGTHNYFNGAVSDGGREGDRSVLCSDYDDVRGEWHDFSMRIEPGKITALLDGKVCETFTKKQLKGEPYAFGPDNLAGNFMLLTNAVGNASQGMRPPSESSKVLVDRVTVTSL